MATRHISKESLKTSSVNPITERDRHGRTSEEAYDHTVELGRNQTQAAEPFLQPVADIKRSLDKVGLAGPGWNSRKLWTEKQFNGSESNDGEVYEGVDGVADMLRLGEQAANEVSGMPREMKTYEKTFVSHMETVAQSLEAMANVDFAVLQQRMPGEADVVNATMTTLSTAGHEKLKQAREANDTALEAVLLERLDVIDQFVPAATTDYGLSNNEAHDFIIQAEHASSDSDDPESAQAGLEEAEVQLAKSTARNQALAKGFNMLAEYSHMKASQPHAQEKAGQTAELPVGFALGDRVNGVQNPSEKNKAWKITEVDPSGNIKVITYAEQDGRDVRISKLITPEQLQEWNAIEADETPTVPLDTVVPTPETLKEMTPELKEATENLSTLREQLAELNAKREKRFAGTGAWKNEERYSEKVKKLYADYHDASRALFTLENKEFLADQSVEKSEKILKIAEHTVTEAGLLDAQILDSYKNKQSRLGKMVEWYGNRGTVSKIAIGIGASALAGVVTGGVGTALMSGSLMATSFEARRREKRSAGEDMITLDANDLAKQYMNSATLKDVFEGAHLSAKGAFEDRIHKEQMKRVKRVAGSLAVGATIGLVTNHLPGMDGLFGGDSAHAATQPDMATVDPTNTPYPTPEASTIMDTAANFGPNNVYVNPNDGLFNVFQQMNIPEDQWGSLMDKVSPELVSHGDAYIMPNGDSGLTHTGQLSQSAFDAIMRAR